MPHSIYGGVPGRLPMPNRPSSAQWQRASCFDDYSHGHAELLRPTCLHNAHSAPLPDPAGTVKHKCTPQVTNRRVICEKDGELFRQPQLQEHFINGSISRNLEPGLPGSAARSDKAEARLKCAVFAARLDAMKVTIGSSRGHDLLANTGVPMASATRFSARQLLQSTFGGTGWLGLQSSPQLPVPPAHIGDLRAGVAASIRIAPNVRYAQNGIGTGDCPVAPGWIVPERVPRRFPNRFPLPLATAASE
jgi:hypothetical protein